MSKQHLAVLCIALGFLAGTAFAIAVEPAPDMQVLKIAILPAPDRVPQEPNSTYVHAKDDGVWKEIEVGKTTWGVVPLHGYPRGVRVQVTAKEWRP